jgi:hypothetical protein
MSRTFSKPCATTGIKKKELLEVLTFAKKSAFIRFLLYVL